MLYFALLASLTLLFCLFCVAFVAIEGERQHQSFIKGIADFPKVDLKATNTAEKTVLPDNASMYTKFG